MVLGDMAYRGHGARRHGLLGTWRSETWRTGDMAYWGHGVLGTWRSETWRTGDMALGDMAYWGHGEYHVPRNLLRIKILKEFLTIKLNYKSHYL